MYSIIKDISYLIRWVVCYFTIEQYPIFNNEAIQWFLGQFFSVYVLLKLICFPLAGKISSILWVTTPSERAVIYFFVHLIVASIVYCALKRLTQLQILPL